MTIVAGRLARDGSPVNSKQIGKRIEAARLRLPSANPPNRKPPKGRAFHPMTQPELAARTGFSMSKVTRWEKGAVQQIDLEDLKVFAVALETTTEELVGAPVRQVPESRVEYEPEAFVEPNLVKRVANDVGLDREKTERLMDMRWSIGLPSEVTLRSYAVDLARGGPKLPDGSAPDEPRAEAIMDVVGEARARRS